MKKRGLVLPLVLAQHASAQLLLALLPSLDRLLPVGLSRSGRAVDLARSMQSLCSDFPAARNRARRWRKIEEIVMELSRVFAVIAAAGSLAAASVRAQDTSSADASSGATSSTQPKARKGSAESQAKPTPYGEVVNGPSTTDADGIPVANPNPLSVEKNRGELGGIEGAPGELTDESNASGDLKASTDGY